MNPMELVLVGVNPASLAVLCHFTVSTPSTAVPRLCLRDSSPTPLQAVNSQSYVLARRSIPSLHRMDTSLCTCSS